MLFAPIPIPFEGIMAWCMAEHGLSWSQSCTFLDQLTWHRPQVPSTELGTQKHSSDLIVTKI